MVDTAYEIHTYKEGTWKIQGFFDDRELAMLEARRMCETNRYPGLRVVEEVWDPASQSFHSRIIFRDSEVIRHNESYAQERAKTRRNVQAERETRERTGARRKRRETDAHAWHNHLAVIAAKGLAIAGLGYMAIYALQNWIG